jgi:hypothetical protein
MKRCCCWAAFCPSQLLFTSITNFSVHVVHRYPCVHAFQTFLNLAAPCHLHLQIFVDSTTSAIAIAIAIAVSDGDADPSSSFTHSVRQ